jgi:hypothetical protein
MNTLMTSGEDNRGHPAKFDGPFWKIVCWIPIVTFTVLMGFAVIASVRFGHWPYPFNPDPKSLRLPLLHAAAMLSYPLAFLSIPVGLWAMFNVWDSLQRRDVVVFTMGASMWAFILPITRRLLEWLVD